MGEAVLTCWSFLAALSPATPAPMMTTSAPFGTVDPCDESDRRLRSLDASFGHCPLLSLALTTSLRHCRRGGAKPALVDCIPPSLLVPARSPARGAARKVSSRWPACEGPSAGSLPAADRRPSRGACASGTRRTAPLSTDCRLGADRPRVLGLLLEDQFSVPFRAACRECFSGRILRGSCPSAATAWRAASRASPANEDSPADRRLSAQQAPRGLLLARTEAPPLPPPPAQPAGARVPAAGGLLLLWRAAPSPVVA